MSRQPFFPLISIRMQEQKGEVVIFQQKADDTMMVLHSQGSQPTLPDCDACPNCQYAIFANNHLWNKIIFCFIIIINTRNQALRTCF